jgi:hypothetical protein
MFWNKPRATEPVVYTYVFSAWPDETLAEIPQCVLDLFELLKNPKMEMQFTEEQFEAFRQDVYSFGITLREVERFPYHDPESVP